MANWRSTDTGSLRGPLLALLGLVLCMSPLAQAEELQDPTAPLAGTITTTAPGSKAEGLPKLQSIILGNGPALAVLDGQSYRIGQQVGGYRLVAISADTVVLEKGGKRQALTLFGSKIRM